MKSQITRNSHRPEGRYSGVYQQQGRMLTDADWNELVEVFKQRLDVSLAELVGDGAPRLGGAAVVADGQGLPLLRPGALVAQGLRGELRPLTPDPQLPDAPFAVEAQADLPGAPPLPPEAGRLFADLWERNVTALEDRALADSALFGADTCTRSRTMVQVKWCPAGTDPASLPARGDARLTLELRGSELGAEGPGEACGDDEGESAAGLGDFLFRLEVHRVEGDLLGGGDRTVWLKWSAENGAEHYPLGEEPEDFTAGDRVFELFDPVSEQHLGWHGLSGDGFPRFGELVELPPMAEEGEQRLVRRWDGYCVLKRQNGKWQVQEGRDGHQQLSAASGLSTRGEYRIIGGELLLNLERLSLKLTLGGTRFLGGDYWSVAVREVEHGGGCRLLEAAEPEGVVHRYLQLAELDANGRLMPLGDAERRRLAFPPLSGLQAADVGLEVGCGKLYGAAGNLQQALDQLCGIDAGDLPYQPPSCPGDSVAGRLGLGQEALTLQAALDELLCRLDAARLPFANPGDATLGAAATVQEALESLARPQAAHVALAAPQCQGDSPLERLRALTGVDPDGTVEKALRALLCHLSAATLPYDPQANAARWQEIVEAEGTLPATVQQALDDLATRLEGGDIRFTLGQGCGAGSPAARLGLGGAPTLEEALNALLCRLDAGHLPLNKEAPGLCAALRDAPEIETVQDALGHLCASGGGGGGCAVTVGEGGRFPSLDSALAELEGLPDLNLCLLPGEHRLADSPRLRGRRSIRMSGSGAGASRIRLEESVAMEAGEINLQGLGFDAEGALQGLSLRAERVVGEGCELERRSVGEVALEPLSGFSVGGSSYDYVSAFTVDGEGNLLLAGYITGDLQLGDQTYHRADGDTLLFKFTPAGELLWGRQFLTQGTCRIQSLAVDGFGNPVVGGTFDKGIDLGGEPLEPSGDGSCLFVVRLAGGDGSHLWSWSFGVDLSGHNVAVAADGYGNVAACGYFVGTAELEDGLVTVSKSTGFAVRLSADTGGVVWLRTLQSSSYLRLSAVAVTSGGDLYFAGDVVGSVDLGQGSFSTSGYDILALRLAGDDGSTRWSKNFYVSSTQMLPLLAVDPNEDLVLTGRFSGEVDFGGGPLSNQGSYDSFVLKVAGDSGEHLWSTAFGSSSSDYASTMAVDHWGDVYVGGGFTGQMVLGDTILESAGSSDGYLIRFAGGDGRVSAVRQFGGSSYEQVNGLAVDREGSLWMAARFFGNLSLGSVELTGRNYEMGVLRFATTPRPLLQVDGREEGECWLEWRGGRLRTLHLRRHQAVAEALEVGLAPAVLADIAGPEAGEALTKLLTGELADIEGEVGRTLLERVVEGIVGLDEEQRLKWDNELDGNALGQLPVQTVYYSESCLAYLGGLVPQVKGGPRRISPKLASHYFISLFTRPEGRVRAAVADALFLLLLTTLEPVREPALELNTLQVGGNLGGCEVEGELWLRPKWPEATAVGYFGPELSLEGNHLLRVVCGGGRRHLGGEYPLHALRLSGNRIEAGDSLLAAGQLTLTDNQFFAARDELPLATLRSERGIINGNLAEDPQARLQQAVGNYVIGSNALDVGGTPA